jgi:hypothetical protein
LDVDGGVLVDDPENIAVEIGEEEVELLQLPFGLRSDSDNLATAAPIPFEEFEATVRILQNGCDDGEYK